MRPIQEARRPEQDLLQHGQDLRHPGAVRPPAGFVPRARLYAENVWIVEANGRERETQVPALTLTFEYGNTAIRASDRRERFFVSQTSGVQIVERDLQAEARAQCLLESFGAVEIDCLPGHTCALDSPVDYIVGPFDEIHAWCSFSAYAVPQLRALGWNVEIDEAYPYRVVSEECGWYTGLETQPETEGWFSLELGVEIEGRRVNLLPALLEILEECPDDASLRGLLLLPTRYRALPVGDGTFVTVPPERLRSLLRVVLDLYGGKLLNTGAVCLPRARLGVVADLEAALGSTGAALSRRGNARLFELGRSLANGPGTRPTPSPGLAAELRPYQTQGVAWLQHLRANDAGGILADDMGLGKTLQTIAHLLIEKEAGRALQPSLIVVPKSLAGNWERELARFAPSLKVTLLTQGRQAERTQNLPRCDVVLTTYPLLLRDLETHRRRVYQSVILDEAQNIKNPKGLTHGAVKALQAQHRLCLTGTPIENHLGELWALFDFLMPGFLGDSERFRSKYRNPIERGRHAGALDSLRRVLAPFILRRMKEDVARELPPKTQIIRPVELQGDQRDLYESIRIAAHGEVRRSIRNKGLAGSAVAILDALMKLRQVCCDPRLLNTPSASEVGCSAKFDAFFELLRSELSRGRRLLVFSQFARMLGLLGKGLNQRGIDYSELTGATVDRKRAVDRFQGGEVDVFLISLKAGGTGLNLTRADTVIHYDPWWNAAAQAQATDRAHRIGQTRPVFVYDLLVAGSVEERMIRLQRRKTELSELLGLGSVPRQDVLSESDAKLATDRNFAGRDPRRTLDPAGPRSRLATPGGRAAFSESDVDDLFAPLGD